MSSKLYSPIPLSFKFSAAKITPVPNASLEIDSWMSRTVWYGNPNITSCFPTMPPALTVFMVSFSISKSFCNFYCCT